MAAISTSANFNSRVNFTVTQAVGNQSVTDADSQTLTASYTHGTGFKQVNNGVVITGVLTANQEQRFDLYNSASGILKDLFGTTIGVPINRVKNLTVFNLNQTTSGCLELLSTGTYNLPIFSSSISDSGAHKIKAYSSWTYNDPHLGTAIENESKYVYLRDCGGSGVCFHMTVLGVDESQPTGVIPTSPYGM